MEVEITDKVLKVSIEEWVGIIVFSVTMLLTRNVNIAFPLTIISYVFVVIIMRCLDSWIESEPMFFERVKYYGRILMLIFVFLYTLDLILTYEAVIKMGIATETNQFLVSIWRIFGYKLGQFLHIILFVLFSIYSHRTFTKSFNYKRILINFMFVLVGVILWFLAVINNIGVFYTTYCSIP